MIRKALSFIALALCLSGERVDSEGINSGAIIGQDGIHAGKSVGGASGILNKGGGASPPSSCAGAIDLSQGCVLPMLGGF
jgi:hypothetical protein